jgi:hypothetical protein
MTPSKLSACLIIAFVASTMWAGPVGETPLGGSSRHHVARMAERLGVAALVRVSVREGAFARCHRRAAATDRAAGPKKSASSSPPRPAPRAVLTLPPHWAAIHLTI